MDYSPFAQRDRNQSGVKPEEEGFFSRASPISTRIFSLVSPPLPALSESPRLPYPRRRPGPRRSAPRNPSPWRVGGSLRCRAPSGAGSAAPWQELQALRAALPLAGPRSPERARKEDPATHRVASSACSSSHGDRSSCSSSPKKRLSPARAEPKGRWAVLAAVGGGTLTKWEGRLRRNGVFLELPFLLF